ncbi:MAG: hypothetical protein GX321_10725 [Clostridiales bacterium]|nr:hypothetical protein [Clostridiales bacterium]
MKKFGKFILGTLSIATLAAGAYYIYNNFIKKDFTDDFDDFDEDYDDDFDDIYTKQDLEESNESREYVSIPIDPTSSDDEASGDDQESPGDDSQI